MERRIADPGKIPLELIEVQLAAILARMTSCDSTDSGAAPTGTGIPSDARHGALASIVKVEQKPQAKVTAGLTRLRSILIKG